MNNIFITAIVISIIYGCIKFIETKFVNKEQIPVKLLVRDSLLVYFSVVISYFIIEQVIPLTNSGGIIIPTSNQTPVFTDNPEF
jgi:hypothetical protein